MLLKGFILPPTTRKGIGNSIKDIKFVSIDNYFLQLKLFFTFCHFGPRVYPKGSLVIALVRVSVRVSVCPSLNISETVH